MSHESTDNCLYLKYIGHSTVLIEMGGVQILTDPLLSGRVGPLRRRGPNPDINECRNTDAILISHIHWDHLHLSSIRLLDRGISLIVPNGAYRILRRLGFDDVREMGVGQTTSIGSIEIRATYARHHGSRYPLGPVADCLGFVVKASHSVYFAGDTGIFEEMAGIEKSLDVALLPVWGWGPRLPREHLNPYNAAEALTILQPRLAVPIHWGTFFLAGTGWMKPGFFVDPPHIFAHHAARLAPKVGVRVLNPGESIQLDNCLPLGAYRRYSIG